MSTLILNLPTCQLHKLRLNYVCFNELCKDHSFNCGDCLYENHKDHIAQVSKIQDLVNKLNQNYRQLLDQQDSDSEKVNRKSQIQQILHEKINVSKQNFQQQLDEIQDQVNQQIEELQLNGQGSSQQSAALAELNGYFTRLSLTFDDEFSEKVKELYAQNQRSVENQQQKQLVEEKFNQNIHKIDQGYKKANEVVEKELQMLQGKLTKVINSLSQNTNGINVWEYSFNKEKYHEFNFENDGKRIVVTGGCSTDKYVISNETIPFNQVSYWEIKKNHTHGCYDSIGVCTNYKKRNGESSEGWAVRVYGDHSDLSFCGKIHDNQRSKFYTQWQSDDKIGLLYDPFQKTLSYFVNGKFIGTPFDNVEGELYFLVEGCHHGSFDIVQNSEIPEQEEITQENIVYN